MTTEEPSYTKALLEDIRTQVKGIGDGHVALWQRLDRMDARFGEMETRFGQMEVRFDVRFDRLEAKVDGLEAKVDGLEAKVDGLEAFASDAQRRLKRIETHLPLSGAGARPKATRAAPPKRHRKS